MRSRLGTWGPPGCCRVRAEEHAISGGWTPVVTWSLEILTEKSRGDNRKQQEPPILVTATGHNNAKHWNVPAVEEGAVTKVGVDLAHSSSSCCAAPLAKGQSTPAGPINISVCVCEQSRAYVEGQPFPVLWDAEMCVCTHVCARVCFACVCARAQGDPCCPQS